jgi:membrane protein implicated in regulation of membrane protease activity
MTQPQVLRIPGWLAWLLAIPALAAAMFFGAVVLLAVLGLALIAAGVLAARFWWLRRKAARLVQNQVIDGEYRVVREHLASRDQSRY